MMGPRAALRARRHRQLLEEAIDRDFYIGQLDADPGPAFDPVTHYLAQGWRAGVEPAPWFDSEHYAWAFPDVDQGDLPPFLHYLAFGRDESRAVEASHNGYEDVRPWFDADFYRARNPELDFSTGVDPFDHYAYTGWREGRDPNAWFSLSAWRAANPDAPTDINPLALHMREGLRFGRALAPGEPIWRRPSWRERRARAASSGLIDERYYLSTYPEVAAAGLSAVDHYLVAGAAELRNPGPDFDTGWWASQRGVTPREALFDFLEQKQRLDGAKLSGRPPLTARFEVHARPEPARVAAHLHLRHLYLAEWLVGGLARWPTDMPIWASVGSEADALWLRRRLAALRPAAACDVRVDPALGSGVLPRAFADRAADVDALLCLHSDAPFDGGAAHDARRGRMIDALLATPSAGAQAAAAFTAQPALAWLHAEADYTLRQASRTLAAGLPASAGWLSPRALKRLAEPPAGSLIFDPDLDPSALQLRMAERIREAVVAVEGEAAPFVWPERRRAEMGPPPPAPSAVGPTGRRWPRENPAVLLQGERPIAPRSGVFDPSRMDIAWVMPDLLKGSGGHMSILRLVEQLARFGHRQTIWVQNPRYPDPQPIKQRMQQWFRPIPDDVAVVALPDDMRAISADAVIATEAWSAFPVAQVTNAKARFYLIQDYEPLFHPAGETAILARQTYDLGLDALTAGDWLLGKAQGHGMWARKWDLAVDHAAYFPVPKDEAPARAVVPRIAVYARRSTPRRAVGLAFAALTELHRRGVVFEAQLFGDDDPPSDLAFPHVNIGIAEPETLGALYRQSDVGLVFSATNYSLVPLEMMACGLPVVELDGESTRAVFRGDEAVLATPTAGAVADALQRLLHEPMAHKLQAGRGLAFVRELSWEASARSVEAALRERLSERARAIDPAAVCAPYIRKVRRASVVIPTYNGGRLFDRVLAAAASQDCAFEYDVLVIDSGSTDRTAEVASKVGGRVWLHNIEQSQFQHGRTRNLGVELTDGEVVAFLTQDALPGDRQWLSRLVEGFDASDRVGAVFGRHRAYPAHGLYAARDLDGWFDQFHALGPLFSTRLGLPSFIHAGSEDWRRLMAFHSDNNSALLRAAWNEIRYPELDWGEDQVLGWEMVRQGFDKAYADQAVVFHSHQRKAGEQLQTAIEEGKLFKAEFGMDLVDEATAPGLIDALTAADTAFAAQQDLSPGVLAMRLESQRLSIEGRLRGAAAAGE